MQAARHLALLLTLTATSLQAQNTAFTTAQAWIGRALILRGAWLGSELEYDSNGHPRNSPKSTDWTLAGFDLATVTLRPAGNLELEGMRVAIGYNQQAHIFERHPLKDEKLRIVLPPLATPQAVESELQAIFSQGIDPALERSLPPYWSHYFLPQLPWADDTLTSPILGSNGRLPVDVVQPVPEKKPEAAITAEARAARIRGSVQASLVVDSEGMPRRITLRNPLGWGLDARVAEALSRYRFQPATELGKPLPVQVIVNQVFDFLAAPAP